MKKKISIVGAGIAGLVAGVYAQVNGFETEIYEQHSVAGGECTAWKRKGYTIDGCINWMCGTKEGRELNSLWQEVDALNSEPIQYRDPFMTMMLGEKELHWYRDLEKLQAHLKDISPQDTQAIDEMCNSIALFMEMEMPAEKAIDLMKLSDLLRMIKKMKPMMKDMKKLGKMSIREYAEQFKSDIIQKAILSFMPENYCAMPFISTAGTIAAYDCGWPQGGSLPMATRILNKYKELGGKISLKTPVKKILIENGKAVGLELENGETILSDYVVSATDTYITLQKLLDGKYPHKKLDEMYANPEKYPTNTSVCVAFGVNCDLSKYPALLITETEPFQILSDSYNTIHCEHYCHEKGFAPEGKSIIKISKMTEDYDCWKNLSMPEYNTAKQKFADDMSLYLNEIYPETKDAIEMVDVYTPLTFERYCGAYRGSFMAFTLTPQGKQVFLNGIIKGLDNFYMAGQWMMQPGGLPCASASGRWAIQRICKTEKILFVGR